MNFVVMATPQGDQHVLECSGCGPIGVASPPSAAKEAALLHLRNAHGCTHAEITKED